ncbi:DUF1684 domain-containing protein [Hymenobacter lutimineralis]|uniref:DUF1684 domain-containing protein n=1 Tax=Hymenobacter lutimineralis TaxID=2606448 RepID=A0A5D6VE37_9BACT|nr:DUF1684 domain-containing protein [Hymenobacter lutimineralis]TYZ13462.1 DUF1684 domain-containing protein [Hymenobacter lutimineralis]
MRAFFLCLVSFLWLTVAAALAQTADVLPLTPAEHARQVAAFQQELNAEFRDSTRTPLPRAARKAFTGLSFYRVNYAACVRARFVPDSLAAPFPMQTSTTRRPLYRKYGVLEFMLGGKPRQLTVYQSLDLQQNPEYRDYLFVPFTDRTNGRGSYGGGRYLDLRRGQLRSGQVLLDFNRAYNPYCAYQTGYSCPVPPPENRLGTEVEAGVMSEH